MKKSALKRILIIFGILVAIFAIINLAWLFMIKLPYEYYCERSEQFCTSSRFTAKEEVEMYYHTYFEDELEYGYKIYQPRYLSFRGISLAIGDNRHTRSAINAETGEVTNLDDPLLIIHISRNAWGQYRYILSSWGGDGTGYAANINRNFEIVSAANQEENEGLQELIDKNYDHLLEIMDYAAEMWELP